MPEITNIDTAFWTIIDNLSTLATKLEDIKTKLDLVNTKLDTCINHLNNIKTNTTEPITVSLV